MKNIKNKTGSFFHFIAYNNFFVIIVVVVFVATGTTFAANPGMIVSQNQQVTSVDNSRILAVNMRAFDPVPHIDSVSEDTDNYYVAYSLNNIGVVDYVWRDTVDHNILKVSKAALKGEDLGIRSGREIGQVVDQEISYLSEVQKKQQELGQSSKVASVTYSGLVGRFFDTQQKVFPSYVPTVREVQEIHPQSQPTPVQVQPQGQQDQQPGQQQVQEPQSMSQAQIEALIQRMIDEYLRNRGGGESGPIIVKPAQPTIPTTTSGSGEKPIPIDNPIPVQTIPQTEVTVPAATQPKTPAPPTPPPAPPALNPAPVAPPAPPTP